MKAPIAARRRTRVYVGVLVILVVVLATGTSPSYAQPPVVESRGDILQAAPDCGDYWLDVVWTATVTTRTFYDDAGRATQQHVTTEYQLSVAVVVGPEPFEGALVRVLEDTGRFDYTVFFRDTGATWVGVNWRVNFPQFGLNVVGTPNAPASFGQTNWCAITP